ncbi:MAG TPA: PAS domain S-box protein, partial [Herpetosiphonaceae bacterium]|nr:PAS domain S-box protein [Herpetosiphonaceae bacterium]
MTTLPDPPDAWFPSPLAQLSDAFDLAPCGYVLTTVDGHFTLVNHTFLQMTGYARDTLLGGGRIQDVLTPPGRIFYETHYAPLMHMQGRVQELAVDVRCADGQSLPVLLSSTQQLTPSGAVHGYRTVLFPARDRRSYEQELLRARREAEHSAQVKAQMLAMLGHEIGTPVTAISLAAQSLARSAEQGRQ